jgi:hypothetical protein
MQLLLLPENDFRAIEAAAHAYASKDGQYSSLSHAEINGDQFSFWMDIPLAVGTVGGLTKLHPLVKLALENSSKSKRKRFDENHCCGWFSSEFCSCEITSHNWNSARTYENAPIEYSQSIRGYCKRKRTSK